MPFHNMQRIQVSNVACYPIPYALSLYWLNFLVTALRYIGSTLSLLNLCTGYLSLMENSLDPDAVQDTTCEEVPVLFADCKSCPCCETCCSEDSANFCQFDVNFYEIAGLNCGKWWWTCRTISYDPVPVEDNDSEPL